MKLSTIIASSLIAINYCNSSPVHAIDEGETQQHNLLRYLKPDNQKCTADCKCFVETGVIGESKSPSIATCKLFSGVGGPAVNECQNRCVSSKDAEELIASGEATVS